MCGSWSSNEHPLTLTTRTSDIVGVRRSYPGTTANNADREKASTFPPELIEAYEHPRHLPPERTTPAK